MHCVVGSCDAVLGCQKMREGQSPLLSVNDTLVLKIGRRRGEMTLGMRMPHGSQTQETHPQQRAQTI
eukprot:SAG11_NODE_11712_length_742_cov_1.940902_1_plen_66_part_10